MHQNHKLFTPKASSEVIFSTNLTNSFTDYGQYGIARLMAKGVINVFKVINIYDGQTEELVVAPGASNAPFKMLIKRPPTGKTCKRIAENHLF